MASNNLLDIFSPSSSHLLRYFKLEVEQTTECICVSDNASVKHLCQRQILSSWVNHPVSNSIHVSHRAHHLHLPPSQHQHLCQSKSCHHGVITLLVVPSMSVTGLIIFVSHCYCGSITVSLRASAPG